ncbi:MAG TPA: hypothetical protein VMT86_16430 [Bryobacteraceae bacterium]|nr:hypothetical protein [Bryobacteraceae bacterium]
MLVSARLLPYGKFFGAPGISREVPGFSIAIHADASLVLLLEGTYISSAADAGSESGPFTLIYNPPRTTHRDRFKSVDGTFLALSVSREAFRSAADWTSFPRLAQTFTSRDVVSRLYG